MSSLRFDLKTMSIKFCISRLYDVDNNGVIDIDEMTEIIEILDDIQGKSETEGQGDLTVPGEDPEPKSAKEKAEMFLEILDVDGSGGITLDEFLKVSLGFCLSSFMSKVLSSISLIFNI